VGFANLLADEEPLGRRDLELELVGHGRGLVHLLQLLGVFERLFDGAFHVASCAESVGRWRSLWTIEGTAADSQAALFSMDSKVL
jgi:hypothetical protein